MKIRNATPEDVKSIQPAPYFDNYAPEWKNMFGRESARQHLEILCRSVEIKKRVVAIIGVTPSQVGVADVWVMMEEEAYEHPGAMAWAIAKMVPVAWDIVHCHRMQAAVEKDSIVEVKTSKLLEFLGFNKEGLLKNYQPGKDFWLYAKTSRYLQ